MLIVEEHWISTGKHMLVQTVWEAGITAITYRYSILHIKTKRNWKSIIPQTHVNIVEAKLKSHSLLKVKVHILTQIRGHTKEHSFMNNRSEGKSI